MYDFRRITLLCLEKRLSKHNMTICSKNLGGHGTLSPPLAMPIRSVENNSDKKDFRSEFCSTSTNK